MSEAAAEIVPEVAPDVASSLPKALASITVKPRKIVSSIMFLRDT